MEASVYFFMQTALHWTNSIRILGCSYQFVQKFGNDTQPKIKIYFKISWLFFFFISFFFSPSKASGIIKKNKREGERERGKIQWNCRTNKMAK